MAETKGIVVEFRGDTTQFNNAVKQVNNQLRATKSDLSTLNKQLKLDPTNVDTLNKRFEALSKLQTQLTDKVKLYQSELDKFPEEAVGTKEWEQLNRELQKAQVDLQRVSQELQGLPTAQVQSLAKKFDELEDKLTKIGDKISDVGKKFSVLSGMTGGLIASGIKYNATLEQQTALFETLTGDVKEAEKIISSIQKSASLTPFSTENLVSANQLLISTGMSAEQSQQTILALGDAISATGGDSSTLQRMASNLQQIQNVGKATSMDIRQFAMAGIDIYGILADSTGKTVKQLQEMDITFDMISDALNKASQEGGRYYGAMEKQSETLNGKISTLKDNIAVLLGELTADLLPIIKDILEGVKDFLERIKNLDSRTKKIITTVGLVITALGPALIIIGKIVSSVGTLSGTISKVLTSGKLVTFLNQVSTSGGGIVGIVKTLLTTLSQILNPITILIGALALLYATNEEFRELINGIVEELGNLLAPALETIGTIVNDVLLVAFDFLKGAFDTIVQALSVFLIPIIESLWEVFVKVASFINENVIPVIKSLWDWFKANLYPILQQLATLISNVVIVAFAFFGEIIKEVIDFVKLIIDAMIGLWEEMKKTEIVQSLGDIFDWLGDKISGLIGWISNAIGWFGSLIDKAKEFLGINSQVNSSGASRGGRAVMYDDGRAIASGGFGVVANIHVTNNGTPIDTAEVNRWVDQIASQVNRKLGRNI